jgi:ribonuclease HI
MLQNDNLFGEMSNEQIKFLTLFCDGASRGNPGNASAGCVLFAEKILVKDSKILDEITTKPIWQQGFLLGKATNNWAEWQGLILGMEHILANFGKDIPIQVFLDSNLVVEQINQKWKVKNPYLQILYQKAKQISANFRNIKFQHIFREYNSRADKMANLALDGE